DLLLTNKWIVKGKLTEQGGAASPAEKFFESGDELWVKGRPQISTINNLACGIPVFLPAFTLPRFKLWAIEATKGKEGDATDYFYPQSSLTMYKYDKGGGNPDDPRVNILNAPYFTASLKNYPNCSGTIEVLCRKTRTYRTQSIIKFDLSSIPSTATVTSAK